MSVFTRRQYLTSCSKISQYQKDSILHPEDDNQIYSNDEVEVKFSLVYIVYKIKRIWPILDFLAQHAFTLISIHVMLLCVYWKLSVFSSVLLLILILFYALVSFKFQPSRPKEIAKDNEKLTLDEVKGLWNNKAYDISNKLISLKYFTVLILLIFTISCMSLLHLSANLQVLKDTYAKDAAKLDDAIFVTFYLGINYNDQSGGDSYLYEIYGFIIILVVCLLERKSQIWLTSKFGYIGSKYDVQEGKFVLEKTKRKTNNIQRTLTQASKSKELSVILEDKEETKRSSLGNKSQDLDGTFIEKTISGLSEDEKSKNSDEIYQNELKKE